MESMQILPIKKPITRIVTIPGSKSYTNRALILSSLTGAKVQILNPLFSDDTKAMINCLKILGFKISVNKNNIVISGQIENIKNKTYKLDANLSGTTIRFLLALSTIIPGVKILFGKEGLNKRPISDLVDVLRKLGAKIEYVQKKGFPPVKVLSSKLLAGKIILKGALSSQYLSALLMIAPKVGNITIEVRGNQISKPYIDMTLDIMKQFGVKVLNQNYKKYQILLKNYKIKQYLVEGDISSASYFFAIAALTKSNITVKNINPQSVQADVRFLKILESMGNQVLLGKNEVTVLGKGIKAVSLNMTDCPDQVQTLAVLAAFAKGITKISGIESLRIKETDRVSALLTELKKMEIRASADKTTLTIIGGNPKGAKIDTYGDHRMAMVFTVAGTILAGMEIKNPYVVNKTFPTFWKKLNSLGIKTKLVNKNIVLIGMRGGGKTTVAKILSKKLDMDLVETDQLVVQKAKLTIPEIVRKYGWDRIRELEHKAVKEAIRLDKIIISTGGGVVVRDHNIDLLKKNGVVFWLRSKIPTLVKRIGYSNGRPPLTNKKTPQEEIEEILKQREGLYKKAADKIIDTDNLTATQVVEKIILQVKGVGV